MATLINVQELKSLLQIREGVIEYDTRLYAIVATASRMIEAACRQKFTKSERTELYTARDAAKVRYDFNGMSDTGLRMHVDPQIVMLRAAPVDTSADFSVWYDPARRFGSNTKLNDEDFFLDPDELAARLLITYPTRPAMFAVKVTYSAGYTVGDDDTLSDDLQERAPDLYMAATLTAVHLWNRANPDIVGTNEGEERGDGRGVINSYGIPKEAQAMLVPYRRVLTGRR